MDANDGNCDDVLHKALQWTRHHAKRLPVYGWHGFVQGGIHQTETASSSTRLDQDPIQSLKLWTCFGRSVQLWCSECWHCLPWSRCEQERNLTCSITFVWAELVFVATDSCQVVDVMKPYMFECNEPYSIGSEEDRNFTVGWGVGEFWKGNKGCSAVWVCSAEFWHWKAGTAHCRILLTYRWRTNWCVRQIGRIVQVPGNADNQVPSLLGQDINLWWWRLCCRSWTLSLLGEYCAFKSHKPGFVLITYLGNWAKKWRERHWDHEGFFQNVPKTDTTAMPFFTSRHLQLAVLMFFIRAHSKARNMVDDLVKYSWIDYYTRAVFLELTTFNPNTNLFTYINYAMEFPSLGSVMPFPRIMSFRVYPGTGAMGKVGYDPKSFCCMKTFSRDFADLSAKHCVVKEINRKVDWPKCVFFRLSWQHRSCTCSYLFTQSTRKRARYLGTEKNTSGTCGISTR